MSFSRSPPIRVGLLGCGTIAYWYHLRALRRMPGATLAAAADPDSKARETASRLAAVPIYQSAEDLLARRDIDAVVICAPTHLHAELAVAAAASAKHFYLEKPIASDAAGGQRVLRAAADSGVTGAVGFNRRLHPLYQQARRLLLARLIGPIRVVQTAFCEPTPLDTMPEWKRRRATGGGVLLDLASHHIDLLRWFLEDEVGAVAAWLGSQASEQDTARLDLTMRGGVEVQGFFSFRAGLADFLEFIGERGTLRIDRHSPRLTLALGRRMGYGVRRRWVVPTVAVSAWRLQRWVRPSADPSYRRSVQAFVDHLHGRPAGTASLVDGVRSLEAILSAEESADRAESPPQGNHPIRIPCASF
jgi:myo-inositol 2-dehydrogenase / D-chiro-inositol 1-dehydrogenase